MQLLKIRFAQIHHVTGVVILHLNVGAQLFRQVEMVHGVFGAEERRGEVIEAVLHLNLRNNFGDSPLWHEVRNPKAARKIRGNRKHVGLSLGAIEPF